MSALTAARNVPEMSPHLARTLIYPVEADTTIYLGALVALDTNGLLVPAQRADSSPLDAQTIVGVCVGLYMGYPGQNVANVASNTLPGSNLPAGAAGALSAVVRQGTFLVNIGGGTIAQANVGAPCYAEDDNTVYLTDDTNARFCAGRVIAMEDSTHCWVDTTDKSVPAT